MLTVEPASLGRNCEIASAPSFAECPEVLQEQVWSKAGQALAMSNISQKTIEKKERELVEAIRSNYSRIKDVEKELSALQLQLRLTAGPKKQALEMIRKKIEVQNEKVVAVRQRYFAAKQVLSKLETELQVEEAAKELLCTELNLLVQQSAQAQLDKMEELKVKLEALSPTIPKDLTGATPGADASTPSTAATSAPAAAGEEPSSAAGASQQQQQQAAAGPAPAAPAMPGPGDGTAAAAKPRPRQPRDAAASRGGTPGASPRPLPPDAPAAVGPAAAAAAAASPRQGPSGEDRGASLAASLGKARGAEGGGASGSGREGGAAHVRPPRPTSADAPSSQAAAGSAPGRSPRPLSSEGNHSHTASGGLAAAKAHAKSSGNLAGGVFQGFDS